KTLKTRKMNFYKIVSSIFFTLISLTCLAQNSSISGTVKYNTVREEIMPDVQIELLNQAGIVINSTITDSLGNYSFNNLSDNTDFYVRANFNDTLPNGNTLWLNGVSTFDIVLIKKYLLGDEAFTPQQLLAADVDESGDVSNIDIVYIARIILMVDAVLPTTKNWRFIHSNWQFNQNNVFDNLNQAQLGLVITDGATQTLDFTGLKAGDVNGSSVF
ncbi:MAG: dockerin type I domain-containing protein, partial [Bacteroidota bacterium]